MKLSIVIVNYRSWGYLQAALDTLQPGFPKDWEIIVVDNESRPEPFEDNGQFHPVANLSKVRAYRQNIAMPVG